jgi:hypothetical protein
MTVSLNALAPNSWSLAAMVKDRSSPLRLPLGEFTVVRLSALRTSAMPRPTPASAAGSTCTRTAGCCPPPTNTCPTPFTCDSFWAMTVLAMSNTCDSGRLVEVSDTIMMGASDGLTRR